MKTMGKWTTMGWGWRRRKGNFSSNPASQAGMGLSPVVSFFSVPALRTFSSTSLPWGAAAMSPERSRPARWRFMWRPPFQSLLALTS